eukprot:6716681-Heterocapsa_arctica.AAC.1
MRGERRGGDNTAPQVNSLDPLEEFLNRKESPLDETTRYWNHGNVENRRLTSEAPALTNLAGNRGHT